MPRSTALRAQRLEHSASSTALRAQRFEHSASSTAPRAQRRSPRAQRFEHSASSTALRAQRRSPRAQRFEHSASSTAPITSSTALRAQRLEHSASSTAPITSSTSPITSCAECPLTDCLVRACVRCYIVVMLPKVHSPEVFAEVIDRVAKGETIAAVAKRIGVDRAAVTNWARRFPEFGRDLAKAMEDGADALADETLRIVDGDDLDDEVEMIDLTTKQLALVPRKVKLAAAGGDPVARARLRSEMRLKLLAARSPEKYGNKVLHAGHDGGAIKTSHAIDIKSIAAQLRAAASGRTIEGAAVAIDTSAPRFEADGKMRRRLIQSSDGFNGGPVSNEGDSQCLPHSTQNATRNAPSTRQSAQGAAQAVTSLNNGEDQSTCITHTSAATSDIASRGGASDATRRALPHVARGAEQSGEGAAIGADGQGGDRGGPATPRGAETAPARERGPTVAKHTSTQNSNNSSTCFPSPAEWSPEDYV